jgi:alkylated DNA repair dioxygenase AlkB
MPGLDAFLKPLREPGLAGAGPPPIPGAVAFGLPDADVRLHTNLWSSAECKKIIPKLAALPDWEQRQILVCGRQCMQNRKTCFYARDPSLNYRYSGIDNDNAKPFPPVVEEICKRVSEVLGIQFNYCLLNLYSDGREKLGWHADDERDLVDDSPIASCSFGATRFFDLRRQDNHSEKTRLNLESGSMLVMGKGTQQHYHHQVPQQVKIRQPRYNLTFRVVQ